MTRPTVIFVLMSVLTAVNGVVDLRDILTKAAYKMAEDAGTTINQAKLNKGLCFSTTDGGPKSGCKLQPEGKPRRRDQSTSIVSM